MFSLKLISAALVFAFTATSTLMGTVPYGDSPQALPASLQAISASLAPQSLFSEKEALKNSARVLLGLTRDDAKVLDLRQLSNDPAFGRFSEGVFFPANDFEKLHFWKFLRQSCTDKEETLRRQRMIGVLMVREEALRNKKDGAYSALSMLKGLFSYEEDGPRDKKRRRNIEKIFEECNYNVHKIKSRIGNYSGSIYALQEFISSCRSVKDPLFNAIIDEVEAQHRTLPFPSVEILMGYAKGDDHEKYAALLEQCEALDKMLVSMGAILAFASFAKGGGFCKTTFDESQPAGYSQGWHFTYPKNGHQSWGERSLPPQVPTNSGRDTPFKVFTASNMSGKTFHLQQDFFIQLAGQAFGWAPAKKANLRFYERLVFIDRADTDSFQNLSAFGKDAKNWLKAIEKLTEDDYRRTMVYLMVDEGFSTTSPEDQSVLLTAGVRFGRKHNITLEVSTHNEDFVNNHLNDEDISFYHFKVIFEAGKEPRFERELVEGPDDSHAIEVARALGLQEVILQKAEGYLAGKRKQGVEVRKRGIPRITPYTEGERARLKNKKGDFLEFFPYSDSVVFKKSDENERLPGRRHEGRFAWRLNREREGGYSEGGADRNGEIQQARKRLVSPPVGYKPLFALLSRDPELSGYPGDPLCTLVGGGANYADQVVLPRLKHMVVATPILEGRQVLERQRMFDELLKENPEELIELAKEFDTFVLALEVLGGYLEGFNLHLLKGINANIEKSNLFGHEKCSQTAELFLAFLDFNIRLTGLTQDNLGIKEDVARLKDWIEFRRDLTEFYLAQRTAADAEESPEVHKKKTDLLFDRYFQLSGRKRGGMKYVFELDAKVDEKLKEACTRIYKTIEGKIPPVSAFDEEKHAFILSEFKKMEPLMQEYLKGYMAFSSEDAQHIYVFKFLPYLLNSRDIGKEFFTRLRSTDSVYMNQFANYLEEMWRTYLGDIRTGMDYMRRVKDIYRRINEAREKLAEFDSSAWMLEQKLPKFNEREADIFLTELSKLTDIFRYAQIVKAKKHARSRFHEKKEIAIKGARDPYASVPEEEQVANDSRFTEEEPIEILSGTNMSGKTHNEKSDIWNLLEAHSTGYSSADGVETPILSRVVYIDRVTAKLFETLSALGTEVELWKKWVKAIKGEGLIFAAADEAWSTTSPKYQAALSHAVFEYGLEEGVFMAISSHNHQFIGGFLEAFGRHARVYNFRTRLADDGSAIYDYVKQPGHEKSNAIMAAKKMGLTALTDEIEELCVAGSPALREALLAPRSSFDKKDEIETKLSDAIATLDIERTRFALQNLERRVYKNPNSISDTIIEQLGIVAKSITSVRGCFGVDLQTLAIGILKDIALKARTKTAKQAISVLESIGHSPNIYGYAYINSLYALREVTEKRASLLTVRAILETDSDILLEVVDKKFNSLRLRGFMDGTRAYIKLLILQEAARKGVVSDHFMQGLKAEIIPALHVLEEMAKSHPPLRVSATNGCLFENFDRTQKMFHRVVGMHYLGGNAVFMSYHSDIVATCSLVLPPTCYSVLMLLLDKMRELDLIDLGSYKTMVQGNYLKESAFLLSCFSFLNLSPDNEFFSLPIALGRFHGLIGSWIFESGCTSHFVDGGETAFFHAAIDQAMYRRVHGLPDLLVAGWDDDIRSVEMLSAAASDKSLARMYDSLKKDVMRFLINQVGLSKDDAENLFPSYDFFTYMHPDVGNELMKSLVRLASYLVIIIGDSEEEQLRKRKLHGEFQDIVNRHVDEIERHLFSILEIDILRLAREDKWNEVRRRLGNAAFSDPETSRSALHYLRAGRYPEYKAMRDVLRGQRKRSRNFARTCLLAPQSSFAKKYVRTMRAASGRLASMQAEATGKGVGLRGHDLKKRLDITIQHRGEAHQALVAEDRIFIVEADIGTPLIKAWQRQHFFMQTDGHTYLYGPMLKRLPVNERCKLVLAAMDSAVEGKALEENEVWKEAERDFNSFLMRQARKAARPKKEEPQKPQIAEPDERAQCIAELTASLDVKLAELKEEASLKESQGLRFRQPSESEIKVLRQEIEAANPSKPKRIGEIRAKIQGLSVRFERTLPLFPKPAEGVSLTSLPGIQAALDDCEVSVMCLLNLVQGDDTPFEKIESLLSHMRKGREIGISKEWIAQGEKILGEITQIFEGRYCAIVERNQKLGLDIGPFFVSTHMLQAKFKLFASAAQATSDLEDDNPEYLDRLLISIDERLQKAARSNTPIPSASEILRPMHSFAGEGWLEMRLKELEPYFAEAGGIQNATIGRLRDFFSGTELSIDEIEKSIREDDIFSIVPIDKLGVASYFMIFVIYVTLPYDKRPENFRRYLLTRKEELGRMAREEKERRVRENEGIREKVRRSLTDLMRLRRAEGADEAFNPTLSPVETRYLMRILKAVLDNFIQIDPLAIDGLYNELKKKQFKIKTIPERATELMRYRLWAQRIFGYGLPSAFAIKALIKGSAMVIELILMAASPFLALGAIALLYRIAFTWHVVKVKDVLKEEVMQALRKTEGVSADELSKFEASGVFEFKHGDFTPLPATKEEEPVPAPDLGGVKPHPALENTLLRQAP